MNLFWRRILTALLFFVLIIIGPALLLYGAGYRVNVKEKRIERAGLLHVTTDPENATMTLDGVSYDTANELVLTGLLPGEYEIIVSKDGYHSWIKELQIIGGQTTFIRDLQLIQNEAPELVRELALNEEILLVTAQAIYTQQSDQLHKINTEEGEVISYQLASDFPLVYVQQDGQEILFSQNANWYRTENETLELLPLTTAEVVNQAKLADNLLTFSTSTGLWQYARNNESAEQILQLNGITDFLVSEDRFWVLASDAARKNTLIYRVEKGSFDQELVATLPFNQYELADEYRNFLTIDAPESEMLYLIDANQTPSSQEMYNDVSAWQWSQDHEQLLIATTFELNILHFNENRRQEVLLRQTAPFSDAGWDAMEQHVFYVSENQLQMIERDERGHRNIYRLSNELPSIEILLAEQPGEAIYFTTDDQSNIWKRALR